ncbi:MAG: alanine--tRNA ligase, partial [Armatimonadetes bacterium]|nr:alanine--tRNA ligase [Armatimonadota bacterium]
MLANDLRQQYLSFFSQRGHQILPSSPLAPIDILGNQDESVLFTGAGMEQFKPYFVGAAQPPNPRICTVQKCFRAVDINSVGDTSHCTFFEMLGNFSFGDYFKAEVIPWTWEFLTGTLELEPERFNVTVFSDDDEAFSIWREVVGLPEDCIHRLGEDHNYWPANAISQGPDGPCGPCSEVFYRLGSADEMAHGGAMSPAERFIVDCDAGRWLEVWNNVFTQFNRSTDSGGEPALAPLPRRNNDTGAGFDRLVMVTQKAGSVYSTDLFQPILTDIEDLSGIHYEGLNSPKDFAQRLIAEHVRSMTFCVADGILPSNEGRGYVLRYIMRRAIRYAAHTLKISEPFLHKLAPRVIEQMGDFYPELPERSALIVSTLEAEETRFRRTLEIGLSRIQGLLADQVGEPELVISGADAFQLHDTWGFPVHLTQDLAREAGASVDMAAFDAAMAEQRERSRASSRLGGGLFDQAGGAGRTGQAPTRFTGYARTSGEAVIQAILGPDGEELQFARPGDHVDLVLDSTPFYAEAGGQVGDTGTVRGPSDGTACGLWFEVAATTRSSGVFRHSGVVREGEASVGRHVLAEVDASRRHDIMRNHTATHLLQAALRTVLGDHVHQKGSLVTPDRLRFDFTHGAPVTPAELAEVVDRVVQEVLRDDPVTVDADVPLSDAKKLGAMALFGERYGEFVRVVTVPNFSIELCGGTHLTHTGDIGLFTIVSEAGVAAGVRRIEAVTGRMAAERVREREELLRTAAVLLRTAPEQLAAAAERLVHDKAELEREVRRLRAAGGADAPPIEPQTVGGVPTVISALPNADAGALVQFVDRASSAMPSGIVVAGAVLDGAVNFAVKVSRDLVAR